MPEQLLAAVKNLTDAVNKLELTLHEYPKRDEVEERFATKEESHSRALKFLGIGLVFVLVAFFASIVVTVGTVSVCFISSDARAGDAPVLCSTVPGYTESQAENQRLLEEFRKLLEQPLRNDRRLDRVEEELGLKP
jgi:hypothetical protein